MRPYAPRDPAAILRKLALVIKEDLMDEGLYEDQSESVDVAACAAGLIAAAGVHPRDPEYIEMEAIVDEVLGVEHELGLTSDHAVPKPSRMGFVYLLSNPAMPGLLKIGSTVRDVHTRVDEISRSTGVPERFRIEAVFSSRRPVRDEQRIHRMLGLHRDTGKEFFRVSLEEAVSVCSQVAGDRIR